MAFSFGNTQPSTFGTPAFGSGLPFGAPATTVAPTFGTPAFGATQTPFGQSAFGTTGAPSLFGTPAKTTPSLFGAPTTTTPSLFGAQPSTVPSLFGATATTTPSLFGAQTTAPSLFGAQTTTVPSLFGAPTTTVPSLFGASTTTAPSLFGAPTTGLFGSTIPQPQQTSLFGGAGGLFGPKLGTAPFGQPQVPQQPAAPLIPGTDAKTQQVLTSFYAINIFGDERDDILKKWNMLQACWGTGKGYYLPGQAPIEYDSANPYFRFKAVSYAVIPQTDSADGLVKLIFNKKADEINSQKQLLITGIGGILGNKPNLTVNIEHVKPVSETETEVMITVSEKGVTGTSRKIHANDLWQFLNQPAQKQQLQSACCTFVGPYMMPTKSQIEEYLKNPPPGIDPHMWRAAQLDNPHPQKFMPTPMNGFTQLKKRAVCEEFETSLHRAFLEKVGKDIDDLKKKHTASLAQIAEQKQRFLHLQHRVLRILVKQETTRKIGLALQPEEEMLRTRLELIHNNLNIPTQFRGKINELMSDTKIMKMTEANKNKVETLKLDVNVKEDVRQFLQMEQNGISHLMHIINEDLKNLKIIHDGLIEYETK